MNYEEYNSEDNSRRCEDNKFNEYNDWLIPFKYDVCQCRYLLYNIYHLKIFEKNRSKYTIVKKRFARHLQYHIDNIRNKRIGFSQLDEIRM